MDLLQSFMGCMYPGSIRTESIESMDYDYSDFIFQVNNIDESGGHVSSGELHLNYKDLIYYRPGKIPIRWPLNSLRRYGTDHDTVFIFEAGRSSPMQGIFAFRLNRSVELNKLANRVKEMLQKLSSTSNEYNNSFKHDTPNNVDIINNNNTQYIPEDLTPHNNETLAQAFSSRHQQEQRKRDASTSTDGQAINLFSSEPAPADINRNADPKPLSYVLIDFDTTKALNESAQDHAASRQTHK